MALACLAEIRPLDLTTGLRSTVRAASANDRRITGLGGTAWEPAIVTAPQLQMSLFNGDFLLPVTPGSATLPLKMPAIKQSWPDADKYMWIGAPIVIRAAVPGTMWPWPVVFRGSVRSLTGKMAVKTLQCEVDSEAFDKNVLTLTYKGTDGAEGGEDLKDRVKPLVIGHAMNVEPVMVDAINSVYQFSAYGAIEEVTSLYERASDFGSSIGDYGSYASLIAASIPAGRWATCLAEGLVRLGAPAYGVITGDIKGHAVNGVTPRLTGAVIEALADIAGVDPARLNSMAAMDVDKPYPANIVLAQQITFIEAARRMALACNYQSGVSLTGQFFVIKVGFDGPEQLTLNTSGRAWPPVSEAIEQSVSTPYWKTIFGANRNWRVHRPDEIAFYADLVEKGLYNPATTYREGNIVSLEDGSRFLYINATPSSGHIPPNATYWGQLSGAVGEQGNLIFRKAATKPSTPSPSSGVPSGWVDDIGSVGSSDLPIWACYGRKASGSSTYTWETPYTVTGDTRVFDAIDSDGTTKDDVVSTPSMQDNSATDASTFFKSYSTTIGVAGSFVKIDDGADAAEVSVALGPKSAQQVLIHAYVAVRRAGSSNDIVQFRIRKNGSTVLSQTWDVEATNDKAIMPFAFIDPSPGASGTNTYELQMQSDDSGTPIYQVFLMAVLNKTG